MNHGCASIDNGNAPLWFIRYRFAPMGMSGSTSSAAISKTPPLKPSPVERSRLAAGPWFLRRLLGHTLRDPDPKRHLMALMLLV
jgi:hypothetical protein